VITTVAQMKERPRPGTRAVVMTMGALHDGHAELMARGRDLAGPSGELVVTVFVNPLQFGPGEDFERYPRTWESDLAVCEREGVDTVFAPAADDMYAGGRDILITPGPIGDRLEGAVRPGHFAGVLTVVAKLLNITRPHAAVFGEKDYQQLVLIRRMVTQLNLPVDVVAAPTVREADGLARSSRNVYLMPGDRRAAAALPRALEAGAACAAAGGDAPAVVAAARALLGATDGVDVDYVAVTDPDLGPPPAAGAARLLIAARVGAPRLIDNAAIDMRWGIESGSAGLGKS
jgi:pantoate--beta-alanine ligase